MSGDEGLPQLIVQVASKLIKRFGAYDKTELRELLVIMYPGAKPERIEAGLNLLETSGKVVAEITYYPNNESEMLPPADHSDPPAAEYDYDSDEMPPLVDAYDDITVPPVFQAPVALPPIVPVVPVAPPPVAQAPVAQVVPVAQAPYQTDEVANTCSCPDFVFRSPGVENYLCKHLMTKKKVIGVKSADGKSMYHINPLTDSCSCPSYYWSSSENPNFVCKHIKDVVAHPDKFPALGLLELQELATAVVNATTI